MTSHIYGRNMIAIL